MFVLDRVASKQSLSISLPQTPLQFFALQIARKLQDRKRVSWYLEWAAQFSLPDLTESYRIALQSQSGNPAEHFSQSLQRLTNKSSDHE
jgi:hypothetical protein